jgi:NAD(P)-dependent dehydrogenase (short-subunit alcohol dehydrogenase family)
MPASLAGQVAFITGAARGQGRAHAVRLARDGADIIAVDICEQIERVPYDMATSEDLAETVRLVEAEDRRIVARKADVRDLASLEAAAADGVSELGRVDIVIANAGVGMPEVDAPAWKMTAERWNTLMKRVVDRGPALTRIAGFRGVRT